MSDRWFSIMLWAVGAVVAAALLWWTWGLLHSCAADPRWWCFAL